MGAQHVRDVRGSGLAWDLGLGGTPPDPGIHAVQIDRLAVDRPGAPDLFDREGPHREIGRNLFRRTGPETLRDAAGVGRIAIDDEGVRVVRQDVLAAPFDHVGPGGNVLPQRGTAVHGDRDNPNASPRIRAAT